MHEERTQVAIVGAGPAGMLLAHLLDRQGVASVVVETRSEEYVASRIRAGILEQSTVDLLGEVGLGARLEREGEEHHGIHLLISPTPYGELIIGDSHDYGSDAAPFNAEAVDRLLLDLAEDTLGMRVEVVERWQGVYGARGPAPFSVLQVEAGISAVLMHTGVGMSVGPALGERTIAGLFG